MSDITLDPKLGVNPRLTICPMCGGDGPDLLLMGIKNYVDTCKSCGMKHYGGAPKSESRGNSYPYGGGSSRKCVKCGNTNFDRRTLDRWEKIPSNTPCNKCQESIDHAKKVVADGGIYWKCDNCRREGVIAGDHELAKEVREHEKVYPPLPIGVTLTKNECPFCRTEN